MHYIPFVLKRTHHASLKILHPIAARNSLTPARFDLLYTLHGDGRFAPFQARIAKALGVSRTTVCKMVRAMVKAGFLFLKIHIWDRRYRRIKLTKYGRRCFGRTMKELRRREIERTFIDARLRWTPSREQSREFIFSFAATARHVAMSLHDAALQYGTLLYPPEKPKRAPEPEPTLSEQLKWIPPVDSETGLPFPGVPLSANAKSLFELGNEQMDD